uniref:Ovule protein n=1 Tax=Heterorhabditis bacteriophora TaxID=37862 RepID=A0A1I7WAZ9_HETBA
MEFKILSIASTISIPMNLQCQKTIEQRKFCSWSQKCDLIFTWKYSRGFAQPDVLRLSQSDISYRSRRVSCVPRNNFSHFLGNLFQFMKFSNT